MTAAALLVQAQVESNQKAPQSIGLLSVQVKQVLTLLCIRIKMEAV